MKTKQHEVVPQTEQQRIECAIDTALLNADLLREQVAELEAALLAETQAKHEAVECLRRIVDGDESDGDSFRRSSEVQEQKLGGGGRSSFFRRSSEVRSEHRCRLAMP